MSAIAQIDNRRQAALDGALLDCVRQQGSLAELQALVAHGAMVTGFALVAGADIADNVTSRAVFDYLLAQTIAPSALAWAASVVDPPELKAAVQTRLENLASVRTTQLDARTPVFPAKVKTLG